MAKDEERALENSLRLDFVGRMNKIKKEPLVEVKEFRKRYGLK